MVSWLYAAWSQILHRSQCKNNTLVTSIGTRRASGWMAMHWFTPIRNLLRQVRVMRANGWICGRSVSCLIVYLILFFSHITRQAQYNHPCYTSCYLYTTSDRAKPTPIIHTQFTPHSALVPANPYLLEEIPAWLLIYVDGKIHSEIPCLLSITGWPPSISFKQLIQLLIINWNGICSNCRNWNALTVWCFACSNRKWKR